MSLDTLKPCNTSYIFLNKEKKRQKKIKSEKIANDDACLLSTLITESVGD